MPNFVFDAKQTTWSGNNSLSCAMAAELAYRDAATIKAQCAAWGLPTCTFLNLVDSQGFVASNGDLVLLAFRGTEPENLRDWMTDADIPLVPFSAGGLVHKGFLGALDDMWADVVAAIKAQQTRGQTLWITGHSLGAALATLATARFRIEQDKPVNGTYVYGSPRCGDGDFQMRYNAQAQTKTFRYVNNIDVVPRVPPRNLGFRHIGTFVYFDSDGDVQAEESDWNQLLDSVKGSTDDFLHGELGPLDDHFTANYVRLCDKNKAIDPF